MTLTKTWLQKQITDLEATRDEIPFGLDEDGNNTLSTLKLALAGMEAVPVAWRWNYGSSTNWRLQEAKPRGGDNDKCHRVIQPLYAAPQPDTVVQDNKSITQHFDDIALETAREIMCDVNRRNEFLGGEVQLLSRIQCRIDDACRAAMLQGAEPVTTDKESDVGENCWSCGKYFTYEQHSECDGYCPHCDSPVDLDDEEDHSSKVVPMEPTEEMISNAWREATGKCNHETIRRIYATMLAAAPQQESE